MVERDSFYLWLQSEVCRLGYREDAVRLGASNSAGLGEIGFDHRNDEWCVYIYERGLEANMARFQSRRDAVYFFFLQLMIAQGERTYPAINFRSAPAV